MSARLALATALLGGALGAVAAPSEQAELDPARPVVDMTMQWGNKQQASTTMDLPDVPDVGEVVDTNSAAYPVQLRRQWVVWRVIHTPGAEHRDALVFLRVAP